MSGKIFISYRREDDPSAAARVRDGLAATFGKANLFMDVDNLLAGQRFDHELTKALAACDVLIAVIGQRWMDLLASKTASRERDYVREEIAGALKRQIIVIPARVGREGQMPPLPRPEDLPEDVRELALYQKHDLAHERFTRDIAELAEAITSLRKSQAAGNRPSIAKAAPWGWIGASAATAVTLAYAGAYFAGVPLPGSGAPASMTIDASTTRASEIVTARQEQEAKLLATQASLKREQEARARAESEAKARADEAERQQAAATRAEAERQAAEIRRRSELAAQIEREAEAQRRAEVESRRRAEEAERQRLAAAKAEEERQRAEAQIKADLEARARRDEEARRAAAESAIRKAEEYARPPAVAEAEASRPPTNETELQRLAILDSSPVPKRRIEPPSSDVSPRKPAGEGSVEDPNGFLGKWKCQSTAIITRTEDGQTFSEPGRSEFEIERYDGKFYWAHGREVGQVTSTFKAKWWFEGNKLFRQTYWNSVKGGVKVTWPIEYTYKKSTMTGHVSFKTTVAGKEYTVRSLPKCTKQ